MAEPANKVLNPEVARSSPIVKKQYIQLSNQGGAMIQRIIIIIVKKKRKDYTVFPLLRSFGDMLLGEHYLFCAATCEIRGVVF